MNKKVALYCACQEEKYLILALFSALELYNLNTYLEKIIILTDLDIFKEDEFADYNIEIINVKHEFTDPNLGNFENRKIKIGHYKYIEKYDQVMYLDADMLPLKDCMDVWSDVKDDEFGICANKFETVGEWSKYNQDTPAGSYLRSVVDKNQKMYTAGFFVYKTGQNIKEFLDLWLEEWGIHKQIDAIPFLTAKVKYVNQAKKMKIKILDDKYNFCPSEMRDNGIDTGKTAVHIHFKRWIYEFSNLPDLYRKHCQFSFPIINKYYSFDDLKQIIN